MFALTSDELKNLRSQNVTSKEGWGGRRYLPFTFTEQGVAMLASILNSPKAIEVNISIVRAFVFIRQYALSHKDLKEHRCKLSQSVRVLGGWNKNLTMIHSCRQETANFVNT